MASNDYLKDLIKKVKDSKERQMKEQEAGKAPQKNQVPPKKTLNETVEKKLAELSPQPEKMKDISVDESKAPGKQGKQNAKSGEKENLGLVKHFEKMEADEEKPSEFEREMQSAEKTLVASYGETKIFKVEGQEMLYYQTPVPRPTRAERLIIDTIKEATTRLITVAPYRVRDPEQRRNVYYQQVIDILKSSPELKIPSHRYDFYANAVVREMIGYGLIDPLIKDDNLEEIMVIAPKVPVYVFHREFEMMTSNIEFYSDSDIQDLANRIAREVNRRIDISSPLLDARLADGSRVNATIPPASVQGSTVTIRKFRKDPYTLVDLINNNTLNAEVAAFLWLAMEGMSATPANTIISGGTGSGKTTLLNIMCSMIPGYERVITIEDTAELNLPINHWIRLESRPPGLEGTGELTLDILTKNSLRMRPDRVIVGEVRHAEAFSLFTAMNTGHDGSLGTVHANSSKETVVRVTSPPMNVPELMLSALDFVVVLQRIHDRKKGTVRRIIEISEVTGVLEEKTQIQTIFERKPTEDRLVRTSVPSKYLAKLMRYTGMTKQQVDSELKKREAFLNKLVNANVRDMGELSSAIKDYILEAGKSG